MSRTINLILAAAIAGLAQDANFEQSVCANCSLSHPVGVFAGSLGPDGSYQPPQSGAMAGQTRTQPGKLASKPAALKRIATTLSPPNKNKTMGSVGMAIGVHLTGHLIDGLTSWKQPEGNPLLATKTGPQAGHFYREGVNRKMLMGGSAAVLTLILAKKYPKLRPVLVWANVGAGVGFATVGGLGNIIRNPYYR